MSTIHRQLIATGEIPPSRSIGELSTDEIDEHISRIEPRLSADSAGARNAAQLALLALYRRRNQIEDPQLLSVPQDVEAISLNGGVWLPASAGVLAVETAVVSPAVSLRVQPALAAAA